jgi:putative ABC transport system permease protein
MPIQIPLLESFKMSGSAIKQNKLRSILSVLGITIGIFCIISVYALVHSLEKSLNNQFSKFGSDVVFIQKWPWDEFGNNYPWWKYLKRPVTKPEEADFLVDRITPNKVKAIAYFYQQNADVKTAKNALKGVEIKCVSYQYNQIQSVNVEFGRYFTSEESNSGQPVVILGASIAENLFPEGSPVGKKVRVGSGICTVIGVCEFEGASMINNSSDDGVFVPSKWGLGFFSYKQSEDAQIMVRAADGVSIDDLRIDVAQSMRAYRRLKPGAENDFAVNKMSMITDAISSLFGQIKKIGLIIGAFAMLVGCFGVANIMFVSVKERTQEIGIQKALGAQKWFIKVQFLLESIWLCIAGGLLGIFFVWLVLYGLNAAFSSSLGAGASLSLGLEDALIGIITSVVVGIIAGFIPAASAANMDPVTAIRSK